MIRRPPRSTLDRSSAASDVYKRQGSHRFHPGANFDDILDLYIFDRKLRLAVVDALERIEVAVRATLSHEMSISHGTHWFMDAAYFIPTYDHAVFLDHVKKEIGHDPSRAHARQVFIQHYYDKYDDPELPPSWMVFEVLSFGSVSQVFKKLKRENLKPVAIAFDWMVAYWLHGFTLFHTCATWSRTINACGTAHSPSSRFRPNAMPTT